MRLGEQGEDKLQLEDELQCVLPNGQGGKIVLAWLALQRETEDGIPPFVICEQAA